MPCNTIGNTCGFSVCPRPEQEQNQERWFAVRVRSRFEVVSSTSLISKGYEVYLPLYAVKHHYPHGVKTTRLPLFPGYVFCRMDAMRRLPILTTPGVVAIVSMGAIPAPIDDDELEAVKTILRSGLQTGPWPFLASGQRVHIVQGPLSGVQGFVAGLGRKQRLVVSVMLLQRSLAVEVDRDWVQPIPMKLGPKSASVSNQFSILTGAA
jgi:transcription antitermination factor NusG